MATSKLWFVDLETTGLSPTAGAQICEYGDVLRTYADGQVASQDEACFVPEHTLDGASPKALEVNRYHTAIAGREQRPASLWLPWLLERVDGAIPVGANVAFDLRFLEAACAAAGLEPTWHYKSLDVQQMAAPILDGPGARPRRLSSIIEALGVDYDPHQHHGALYDAQLAMKAYDALVAAGQARRAAA